MAAMMARLPTMMPACGPPSSLSPLKVTTSAPAATISGTVGSLSPSPSARKIGERARPEIDHGDEVLAMRQLRELAHVDLGGEADDGEVRAMHLEQERRVVGDGALVIARVRAIGGADLDEARARCAHDVGHAERAADFDELAARDDDAAPRRQLRQRQQHRRRAVVDDERVLGAGQRREELGDVLVPRAAPPRIEPVLEVRVAARDRGHARDRVLGQRRAPEVRVQDDAGRVEHRL